MTVAPKTIVQRDPGRQIANDRNPRTHSDSQIGHIAASMREFGFTIPVLINPGGRIIAGQRAGRRVRAIELAPSYVDLAIARWRLVYPDEPVTLAASGRTYDVEAAERA